MHGLSGGGEGQVRGQSPSGFTYQLKQLEEVYVGIEHILDLLQPLLGEGAHGVADGVHPSPALEDDKAFQQGLAAGDVLQGEIWHSEGKLEKWEN